MISPPPPEPEKCEHGWPVELLCKQLDEANAELAALKSERDRAIGSSELERGLTEFRAAMLAKFSLPRVVAKQGPTSVTIDGNLDKMRPGAVEDHYTEEIQERLSAEFPEDKAREDVDVANMAFLDWWCQRKLLFSPASDSRSATEGKQ